MKISFYKCVLHGQTRLVCHQQNSQHFIIGYMCSGHGLNCGIDANFARELTLKRSIGQRHVELVILTCIIEIVHEIIDGPSYIYMGYLSSP